eukprot:GHVT01052645.1.p1 GENE.GHVT01052645.1~~GHVT01052645.1.p1  ORF type:complete len:147 (-),score=30.70 GHVT01052645.1:677-1117(-)
MANAFPIQSLALLARLLKPLIDLVRLGVPPPCLHTLSCSGFFRNLQEHEICKLATLALSPDEVIYHHQTAPALKSLALQALRIGKGPAATHGKKTNFRPSRGSKSSLESAGTNLWLFANEPLVVSFLHAPAARSVGGALGRGSPIM